MPAFNYLARDEGGRVHRGEVDADTAAGLRSLLQSQGLRLLSCKTKSEPSHLAKRFTAAANPVNWLPVRSIHVEVALEQLAVMLKSGLGLLESLRTIGQQSPSRGMRMVCAQVAEDIQDGSSLAEAMSQHRCFPPLIVQLVKVGEATGNLELVLKRGAVQLSQQRQNRTNLLTALAYPSFVAVAALAVAAYLVMVVIPELRGFLVSMGRRLPAMTQSLVDVSVWLQINGPTLVVIFAAVIATLVILYFWPPGRLVIDRWLLRVPIIGHVLRLSGTVTFSAAMSVMIRSGITMLEALRTVEHLHGNRHLAARVAAARDAIIQGEGLSKSLSEPNGHMPMLASMIAVAESTGQMDEILEQVADFHDARLQATIKRLSAMVEPAIILVVGSIVGYVYIAFFLALFSFGGVQ